MVGPCSFHVDWMYSMLIPCGLDAFHAHSMWTGCIPSSFHVDWMHSILIPCGMDAFHPHSMWTGCIPCGIHVESMWSPCGMWGESKDLPSARSKPSASFPLHIFCITWLVRIGKK